MTTDTDAPTAADDDRRSGGDPAGSRSDRQPRTDRRAGKSVDCTAEMLYLTRIVALEARVQSLEGTVAQQERDLRTVVDRYERVLQGRDTYRGEPLVDPDALASDPDRRRLPDEDADSSDRRGAEPDPTSDPDRPSGLLGTALDRLRTVL